MTIEEMIKAWKSDDEAETLTAPASPVGDELSDEELIEATGGIKDTATICLVDSCGLVATICASTF